MMSTFLIIAVVIIVLVHGARSYLATRTQPALNSIPLAGVHYRVGDTSITIVPASENASGQNASELSIVCFPGFLETPSYFIDLYGASGHELILVNNANYYHPFEQPNVQTLDWGPNPHSLGTIEHDAHWLGLVVQKLASHPTILLHGHSRGGAVVLDAGRQYPQLMSEDKHTHAILEAAVVPGAWAATGKAGAAQSAITAYLLPFVFSSWRGMSEDKLAKMPMMHPSTATKTKVLKDIFKAGKQYSTLVTNMSNIAEWQDRTPDDVYSNYPRLRLVMGAKDSVLDNSSMQASGKRGEALNRGMKVVPTENTNHFVSLENPEAMRSVVKDLLS